MTTNADRELLVKAKDAIREVYKAVGSPGDFGYGTPQGAALRNLYDAYNEICATLKERAA
ncbi:hypothetical protein ABNQ39_20875 [Azospirillum sp. A26]|uniref:hypothetical protein n=1 Tax=unclassified Azospirillum TaxID=2630922 RepID=UPI000D641619|nr:hypothetical protein [Azospirillum sp. TSA6c]